MGDSEWGETFPEYVYSAAGSTRRRKEYGRPPRGVKLLHNLTHPTAGGIKFIASKITDSAMFEALETPKAFFVGTQGYSQTPAFYFAPEASNSLRQVKGGDDIFPQMTEAYDCDDVMKYHTRKHGKKEIINPCMNVLACSTFEHLSKMLTEGGILGGFASRFSYVIGDDRMIRNVTWGDDGTDIQDNNEREQEKIFSLLVEDLQQIYHLTGRFTSTKEWRAAFTHWFPTNDERRYSKPTEKEQTFYSRKHVSVVKLAMTYSVSESNDMILTVKHWDKAMADIEELEAKHNKVIGTTHDANAVEGATAIILDIVKQSKGSQIRSSILYSELARRSVRDATKTVNYMLNDSKVLSRVVGKTDYIGLGTENE